MVNVWNVDASALPQQAVHKTLQLVQATKPFSDFLEVYVNNTLKVKLFKSLPVLYLNRAV